VLTPIILATREAEIRRITARGQLGQIVLETPSQKASRVAQMAEHLPSKCKALSSKPSTAKNKQQKNRSRQTGPRVSLLLPPALMVEVRDEGAPGKIWCPLPQTEIGEQGGELANEVSDDVWCPPEKQGPYSPSRLTSYKAIIQVMTRFSKVRATWLWPHGCVFKAL
jgi:hypothetical protein